MFRGLIKFIRHRKGTVKIIFRNKDESLKEVDAQIGDNILSVAHKNDIDIEGACDA